MRAFPIVLGGSSRTRALRLGVQRSRQRKVWPAFALSALKIDRETA